MLTLYHTSPYTMPFALVYFFSLFGVVKIPLIIISPFFTYWLTSLFFSPENALILFSIASFLATIDWYSYAIFCSSFFLSTSLTIYFVPCSSISIHSNISLLLFNIFFFTLFKYLKFFFFTIFLYVVFF